MVSEGVIQEIVAENIKWLLSSPLGHSLYSLALYTALLQYFLVEFLKRRVFLLTSTHALHFLLCISRTSSTPAPLGRTVELRMRSLESGFSYDPFSWKLNLMGVANELQEYYWEFELWKKLSL